MEPVHGPPTTRRTLCAEGVSFLEETMHRRFVPGRPVNAYGAFPLSRTTLPGHGRAYAAPIDTILREKMVAHDNSSPSLEQRQKELQKALDRMSTLFADSSLGLRKVFTLTDEEFNVLRKFIHQRSGIAISPTRKYLLENRLTPRLRELGMTSFGAYLAYLQQTPRNKPEEKRLFDLVTTNETSFFRNTPQLEVFRKHVLPELLERNRKLSPLRLHIWSAGCSTGEEPYTLGIICQEVLGAELPRWRIRITAHDISEAVLQTAKQGFYSDHALRTTPKHVVQTYFEQHEDRYRIKAGIRNMVRFGQFNLNDSAQLKRMERADIIFCRNVIIYFDTDMKRRVIQSFAEHLDPGGYLFIGHSESLHNLSDVFEAKHFPGAMVYRKNTGAP